MVLTKLKDIKWDSILEVGCDTGVNLEKIKQEFPNKKIVGIDIANETEGSSMEKGFDIKWGDGRSIDYKDKLFDVVFCSGVLVMCAVEDFKKIISEMIRVAKKRVIIIEPHSETASKDGQYYSLGRLIANYRFLEDKNKVKFKKMYENDDSKPWGKWGHIITIDL